MAIGSAGTYVGVAGGAQAVAVSDSGTVTALATVGPSIGDGSYYTLVAYESNGVVKASWVGENDSAPASGTANLRVLDLASDAGALDVYITAPGVDLASVGTPTFSVGATGSSPSTSFLAFTPGTYRVRVTAAGNRSDLRLDMPAVALADQQIVTVLLTPTTGGALVDGGVLVERAAYTAALNGNARVRLVSGVPAGTVAASVGGATVEPGAASPSIGTYVTVPAGSAAWSITVNGNAAAVPPLALTAGSDSTLLVTGPAAAAAVTLVADDNHAPGGAASNNMRLVNALAGTSVGLSLTVDFAIAASNVLPGSGSAYKTVASNTNQRIEVTSPLSPAPLSLQTGLSLPAGGVYTVFVLGDIGAPVTAIRRDR
ncbi:MAG: DUF4397 domain-containing protein [Comamonadaceae bacterium]|nr:DUF4397 domain-containing protein [Comamonadaceae bacterium]